MRRQVSPLSVELQAEDSNPAAYSSLGSRGSIVTS
jgi:hypothetical protein